MTASRRASRARTWLLARPEPREPVRRIVSLGSTAVALVFLAIVVGQPPSFRVAVSRVLWLLIFLLAAGLGALFVRAWRRGRAVSSAHSPSQETGDEDR
jgi:hypothetical protein